MHTRTYTLLFLMFLLKISGRKFASIKIISTFAVY